MQKIEGGLPSLPFLVMEASRERPPGLGPWGFSEPGLERLSLELFMAVVNFEPVDEWCEARPLLNVLKRVTKDVLFLKLKTIGKMNVISRKKIRMFLLELSFKCLAIDTWFDDSFYQVRKIWQSSRPKWYFWQSLKNRQDANWSVFRCSKQPIVCTKNRKICGKIELCAHFKGIISGKFSYLKNIAAIFI